jgi:hypothetical protein
MKACYNPGMSGAIGIASLLIGLELIASRDLSAKTRFTLRSLFGAVTVFGVCLLWMTWQFEAVRERERLMNARVGWDLSNPDQARLPFERRR